MKISNFKPWGILVVMFVLVLTLAACQEEAVETLEITETSVTVDEGEEYQLSFTTTIANDRLTWISSSNEILTVVNGRIQALEPGRVTVRVQAKNGAIYDQVNVVVSDVPDSTPSVIEINVNGEVIVSENPITVSDIDTPTQEGATFVGWFTDASLTQAFDEEVIETSITLYPKFEVIPSAPEMVTVDLFNEAGEPIDTIELQKGSALNRADLPEEPENFVGYYTESMVCGDMPFDVDGKINEDVSLTQVLEDATTPCVAIESVTIEGTPQVGETLTAAVTPENADVTIQWQVDGTVVGTGETLELEKTYETSEVSVSVTGQNDFTGSAQSTSEPVEAIIYTVTVINEAGETLTTLDVEDGDAIDAESLPELVENEMGYYTNSEACDSSFDLDSPIDENKTLYVFTLDNQLPCAELELLTITGEAKVGETLIANVFPAGADVSYQWFVSDNNIVYTPLVNVTGPALVIDEDLEGKYIAVNVSGENSYQGLLKTGTSRILSEAKTLQETESSQEETPQQRASRLISEENYIGIKTEEDLRGIANDGNYIMLNDITIQNSSWDSALSFNGTLDGNGYKIENLNMTGTAAFLNQSSNITLSNIVFSNVNRVHNQVSGIIKNINDVDLSLSNVHISEAMIEGTSNRVGGFVGQQSSNARLTIISSSFSGNINTTPSALGEVGGFIGKIGGGSVSITNSFMRGNIEVFSENDDGRFVGGLIGWNIDSSLSISTSYSSGNISSNDKVGGIVGEIRNGTISDSFSVANVYATKSNGLSGGIAGNVDAGSIKNSYFGGLVYQSDTFQANKAIYGEKSSDSTFQNNYYPASVNGNDYPNSGSTIGASPFSGEIFSQISSTWDVAEYSNFKEELWILGDVDGINTLPWLSWQEEPLPEQIINP